MTRPWFKPAVRRIETPRGPAWIKDASEARIPWLARWQLRRERRVLERLAGIEAVPPILEGKPDTLVVGEVAGAPMRAGHTPGGVRHIADRLLAILDQIHARRVYHLDLRHKKNIIVGHDGVVRIVDFGAAVGLGPIANRCFGKLLSGVDRRAAIKYVARWSPEHLSTDEAQAVLRGKRWRRLWLFSRHAPPPGEYEAVRGQAKEGQ